MLDIHVVNADRLPGDLVAPRTAVPHKLGDRIAFVDRLAGMQAHRGVLRAAARFEVVEHLADDAVVTGDGAISRYVLKGLRNPSFARTALGSPSNATNTSASSTTTGLTSGG